MVINPQTLHKIVLDNISIIDGTGSPLQKGMKIVIDKGKILAVGPKNEISTPETAKLVDCTNQIALPGFIDLHIHTMYPENEGDFFTFNETKAGISALTILRKYLRSGVMAVRDVGAPLDAILGLKQGILSENIQCADLYPCGPILTITGGHGAELEDLPSKFAEIADTPQELQKIIRKLHAKGIRHVKISPYYHLDWVKMAVNECEWLGMKITTHGGGVKDTHPPTMVYTAVEGGVHCVEHIPLLESPTLHLMKQKHTFLVPTLAIYRALYEKDFPPVLLERGWSLENQEKLFAEALELGIPVGIGTDFIGSFVSQYPNCYFEEIRYLHNLGMSALNVIKAASLTGAQILGESKIRGSIEPGKIADIQIFSKNPLDNLEILGSPEIILKNGKFVKIAD